MHEGCTAINSSVQLLTPVIFIHISSFDVSFFVVHFVNGRREDIWDEVRTLGLHTLEQAKDLAQGGREGKAQFCNTYNSSNISQLSLPNKSRIQSLSSVYTSNF